MEYSIVENGIVTNVVIANSKLANNWHEGNHGIGATFDGVDFTQPVVEPTPVIPPPPPSRTLSHREFLKRLTSAEFKAIRQAAKTNADVDMFMYLFERSQSVDLDDADTAAGIQMLEAGGILGVGRAAEILA